MNHNKSYRKLGRRTEHRLAMLMRSEERRVGKEC